MAFITSYSSPLTVVSSAVCGSLPRVYRRALQRRLASSGGGPYDVAVVGGGPGGYVAAIKAAQMDMKTVCIERRGTLGGTCLNVGCIPSKALLNISHKFHEANKDFGKMGITFGQGKPAIDVKKMLAQKEKAIKGLTGGIEGLFKKNGVTYVKGEAKLDGPTTLSVNPLPTKDGQPPAQTIEAKNIILATGSEPSKMPGGSLKADEKVVVTSTGALSLTKVPKKMVVVGGGVIGLELGSVWSRLGAKVEVIEFMDTITPGLDGETRKAFQKILEKQGLKFNLSSKVTGATVRKDGATVSYENKAGIHKVDADVVLLSVGRTPVTANIGLEKLGVSCDRIGRVPVDKHFKVKGLDNVYAIGDIIEGPMLAHKAEDEGIALATYLGEVKAKGLSGATPPHVNYNAVPSVIYTHPEVAGVGKTEEELIALGVTYKKGSFPMMANSRARTNDDAEGLCKIMYDPATKRLLGAWIIGVGAGELIAELTLAMEADIAIDTIIQACHAHPTISEAVREACMHAVFGKAIHMA